MTPQQIDALKLTFEAHCKDERHHTVAETRYWCRQYKLIAQAAIAALAEHAMQEVQRLGQEIEQEPVAIKRMKEWIEYLKRKSDFGQHMKIPSEMSAGTCWELALELEQFINTTPPQRTEQEPVALKETMQKAVVLLKTVAAGLESAIAKTTTPPQRTWVELTDEDRNDCLVEADPCECLATPEAQELMRCVEAKSRSKNQ